MSSKLDAFLIDNQIDYGFRRKIIIQHSGSLILALLFASAIGIYLFY